MTQKTQPPGATEVRPPRLLRGLYAHRETFLEALYTLAQNPFAKDPRGLDPSGLGPVSLGTITPDPDAVRAFIHASGGDVALYERDGVLLLPPTYAATWGLRGVIRAIRQARLKLPLARVLHAGNAVRVERQVAAGTPLDIEARLTHLDVNERRAIVTGRLTHRLADGETAFTVDMTMFFPGGAGKKKKKGKSKASGNGARRRREVERVPYGAEEIGRFRPSIAQNRAYAATSGDFNPVHLLNLAAKASGFRRAFIHGYQTKAIVGHRLIASKLGGDPRRLLALDVSFRRPILCGEEVGIYLGAPSEETPHIRPLYCGPGPGEGAHVTGSYETRA